QGFLPRRYLPEFCRDLLRRHVLLAHDTEEADHRSLREPKLRSQLRRFSFSFRSRLTADRNLLRKDLNQPKLFLWLKPGVVDVDWAIGDATRGHATLSVVFGLRDNSSRHERDHSHKEMAEMHAAHHGSRGV